MLFIFSLIVIDEDRNSLNFFRILNKGTKSVLTIRRRGRGFYRLMVGEG